MWLHQMVNIGTFFFSYENAVASPGLKAFSFFSGWLTVLSIVVGPLKIYKQSISLYSFHSYRSFTVTFAKLLSYEASPGVGICEVDD